MDLLGRFLSFGNEGQALTAGRYDVVIFFCPLFLSSRFLLAFF